MDPSGVPVWQCQHKPDTAREQLGTRAETALTEIITASPNSCPRVLPPPAAGRVKLSSTSATSTIVPVVLGRCTGCVRSPFLHNLLK